MASGACNVCRGPRTRLYTGPACWRGYAPQKKMPVKDSFIAATAIHHNLTVITRNVADFRNAGVPVINPFLN